MSPPTKLLLLAFFFSLCFSINNGAFTCSGESCHIVWFGSVPRGPHYLWFGSDSVGPLRLLKARLLLLLLLFLPRFNNKIYYFECNRLLDYFLVCPRWMIFQHSRINKNLYMTTTFRKNFLTITAAIMRKALIFSQCEINEIIYDGNNKQALFTYLQRHIIIIKIT